MTVDQLVDRIFAREGDRYADRTTVPPIDQPTGRGGITLPVLQAYRAAAGLTAPATVDDLKALDHAQARAVVTWKLDQISARDGYGAIAFEPLRAQMIDFSYNSGDGAGIPIRWLQRTLRVPLTATLDAATIAALDAADPWLVNQALIAARIQMIESGVDAKAINVDFERGLDRRAETFSLLVLS